MWELTRAGIIRQTLLNPHALLNLMPHIPGAPTDEEIAYKLVELYVREVSQRGEKRQMGLDTIINAYVYTLARLRKKREELGLVASAVEREEEKLAEVGFTERGEEEKDQFDFS